MKINGILAFRRSAGRGVLVGIVAIILCSSIATTVAGGAGGARSVMGSKLSNGKKFPLEMDVPSSFFAQLGEGKVGPMRWGLYAYRGRVKTPARTPCLQVATLTVSPAGGGGFQGGNACASVGITASSPISVQVGSSEQQRVGGPLITVEVVGIGVAPTITTLKVKQKRRPEQLLHTRLVTPYQADKAKLNQFRYAVLTARHALCIQHISGFDDEGLEVLNRAYETPLCEFGL